MATKKISIYMQKLLTLRVEPSDGNLEENKREALILGRQLNCKIVFTFKGKDVICNPFD